MFLKNILRNLMGFRRERETPPAGPMPPIGSSIIRERLRICLKYPIDNEQWRWFSKMGWRTVDMRTNRRRYMTVPDRVLVKIMKADEAERERLHGRLVRINEKKKHPKQRQPNHL